MQEHFHESRRFSGEQLHKLIVKSNQPALWRFLLLYSAFVATAIWGVWAWHEAWWHSAMAIFATGVVGCSMFAALHETAHNTAFASMGMNKAAAFLAGLAHIYPASIFRELHFTHHRHTHIEGLDPEISLLGAPAPSPVKSFFVYIGWITGLPLLLFKLMMLIMGALAMPEPIRKKLYPFVQADSRWAIMLESWVVLAAQIAILYGAIYIDSGFWALCIGQCLTHLLLSFYLIMEHNGLPHEGSIFDKTRSMPVNGLIKFIMWNMPYHAEHHAYPALPFHALPKAHELLADEIIHKKELHLGFHIRLWRYFLGRV
jgi:fatty acid desaturase